MSVPRQLSSSGYYHVVMKGNAGQLLFEKDHDRQRYLEFFAEEKKNSGLTCPCFCLMDNHTHLLVGDTKGALSNAMNHLAQRYALRFNYGAGRSGVVFRRPFWSEPIETDDRLLRSVNYIHYNPEVAEMSKAGDYRWSSYRAYADNIDEFGVADTELVLGILGGRNGFLDFAAHNPPTARPFNGSKLSRHHTDTELLFIAKRLVGSETLARLKTLRPRARAPILNTLYSSGFTVKQLARLSGLSPTQVRASLALA